MTHLPTGRFRMSGNTGSEGRLGGGDDYLENSWAKHRGKPFPRGRSQQRAHGEENKSRFDEIKGYLGAKTASSRESVLNSWLS